MWLFIKVQVVIALAHIIYIKKHSTLHPLVHFMNFVTKSSNNKEHALAIFCDLRKAFDTVDHEILLKKLKNWEYMGLS